MAEELTNAQKAGIIGGIIAGVVGTGAVVWYLTQPSISPPSTTSVASIQLSVTNPTEQPGASDTFPATAYDANGNPVSGATLTLTDLNTGNVVDTEVTDSSGNVTFIASIPSTATSGQVYQFQASG